jgi:hypothetical protein
MGLAEVELLNPRSMNRAPQRSSRGAGVARHRAKKALQADLAMSLLAANVPRPIPGGRVRATATVYSPTRRRRDEGNYRTGLEKSLGDALAPHDRDAPFRWLDDDQPPAFTFGAVTFELDPGRPARVVIRLVWGDELADELERELAELRGPERVDPTSSPFDVPLGGYG